MAYQNRGTIDVQDYWAFLDSLNNVWGAGSGSNGYGQTSLANTLVSTTKVTAAQWATLISRLDSVRNHQRGTTSGITAPSAGNTISFNQTLSSQMTDIVNNRFSTNTRGTALPTGLGNPAISNANVWTGSAVKEFNVTFNNNDAARWFFNSGGLLTFYGNIVGNTNQKSADWYNLLNTTLGTVTIGANAVTRSGTGGDTGGDFDQTYGYNGYIWATANDVEGRDPKRWSIEGSNDQNRWVTLDFVSDLTVTSSRNTYVAARQIPFSAFRYIRWVTYDTKTPGGTDGWQASEFILQKNNANVSMSGITVTSNFTQTVGQEANKLIDNNVSTKCYSGATTGPWIVTFDLTNTNLPKINPGGWSGSPIITSGGFSNLSATYSTLVQVGSTNSTYDYNQNYITVEGRTVSNGIGVRMTLTDASEDYMGTGTSLDFVNGNLQVYVGFTPPETTFLANTWGAPSRTTLTNTQQ